MYALSEEHRAIREAVRAVCDAKVAPYAAEVDETGAFPQQAYDALVAADFAAPHIAEEYGGAGADALATCIVIEEVARACAASSANRPAASDRRNTSTQSTGKGTSASVAYPCSPWTTGASGWMGTMRLPLFCRNSAMR